MEPPLTSFTELSVIAPSRRSCRIRFNCYRYTADRGIHRNIESISRCGEIVGVDGIVCCSTVTDAVA